MLDMGVYIECLPGVLCVLLGLAHRRVELCQLLLQRTHLRALHHTSQELVTNLK